MMKLRNKTKSPALSRWTAASAGIAIFMALISTAACSRRVEKNPMRTGETVTLMPQKAEALTLTQKPKHVRVIFDIGGKIMSADDDVKILMYENDSSKTPKLSATSADLAQSHKNTGCPRDAYHATKDAMVGDVLFCNNSIDIDSLKHFVAKREGKDDKVATNALLEFEDPASGLASYIISFH